MARARPSSPKFSDSIQDRLDRTSVAPIGYQPSDLFNANAVSIKDVDNPCSLVNKCDGLMLSSIALIPDELFLLTERELKEKVNPDDLLCRLRISFWDEYMVACDNDQKIRIPAIMRGLTYTEYFFEKVLTNPEKLAWVIKPPQDFLLAMRDLLSIGLERMREILQMPLINRVPLVRGGKAVLDGSGKVVYKEVVNTKALSEIRAITHSLMDRVHGAVIQRNQISAQIDERKLVGIVGAGPAPEIPLDALGELDRMITVVNQKIGAMDQLAKEETIDVVLEDGTTDAAELPVDLGKRT